MANIEFQTKREKLLIELIWEVFDRDPEKGMRLANEAGLFDEARNMKDSLAHDQELSNEKEESYRSAVGSQPNPFADVFGAIQDITNDYAAKRGLPIPYKERLAQDLNIPNDTEAAVPGLEFIVTEIKQERVKA